MSFPVIYINSSTGSDVAASGSGGTAVTAGGNDGAATVAASADVNLLADAPDLSGVAVDGSVALWVDSSSGRQFSKITAINNTTKVVTCEDTFANTESNRNWGIGGKRATIGNADSRTLLGSTGAKDGWVVVFENDESISTALSIAATVTIRGDSETTHRKLLQTGNTNVISTTSARLRLHNMKLAHSNITKTNAHGILYGTGAGITYCRNCIFGDATDKLLTAVSRSTSTMRLVLDNCEIAYCTDIGLRVDNSNWMQVIVVYSWIHDNTSHGVSVSDVNIAGITLRHNIIEGNGGDGVNLSETTDVTQIIENNTIHGNTGDGLDCSTAASALGLVIKNNNFTGNGGYGVNAHSTINEVIAFADYNNYGTGGLANSSGARNNLTAGTHDIAVDPSYTNAGSNNFEVGTSVKALGYPVGGTDKIGAGQSATDTYIDIGAAQREEAGSVVIAGYIIGDG